MKTMTCRELGGTCEQALSAETWDGMVRLLVEHVTANHPDVAKQMEAMHREDPKEWRRKIKPKWDATREDSRSSSHRDDSLRGSVGILKVHNP